MTLSRDFIQSLKFMHPKEVMEDLNNKDRPRLVAWIIRNEIRPCDLYCWLYARFGPPNGIQNFLRHDSSDNLIHWEWVVKSEDGLIRIQGLNFRTEVWFPEKLNVAGAKENFIRLIKEDFQNIGSKMGVVRGRLEHWMEFVNPYIRTKRAITDLYEELKSLDLQDDKDFVPDVHELNDTKRFVEIWDATSKKYSKALGLCFGIRAMLPVMAESFVNLLLYILMKPELKKNQRLRESIIRQPIDIRVQSLSNNCIGFQNSIDYTHDVCRKYQMLVNERNDLLHGNIVPEKLKFNELYFKGKVPIFKEYSTMWERSFGVMKKSVGLHQLETEIEVVKNFTEYLTSCISESHRELIDHAAQNFDLGYCIDDGRLGILFSNCLVDMVYGDEKGQS